MYYYVLVTSTSKCTETESFIYVVYPTTTDTSQSTTRHLNTTMNESIEHGQCGFRLISWDHMTGIKYS